nr:beta-agarase [uncultured bacterium]
MKKKTFAGFVLISLLLAIFSCNSPKTFKIQFDSSKEVSGQKFALKDISPDLPANWDDYNFVVIEFKISTAQRFHVGFNCDWGYNELRVMSYTPNAWSKLAIPLKFYRYPPGAAADLAATYNQPRYTGWVNLGGRRGPLHAVDSIGIRMRVPINNPNFEIRSVSLSVEDPGDVYLGEIPAVDEFGQSNLCDYDGKIHSIEQLQNEWTEEENEEVSTADYQYSKFGGYLNAQVKGTGFFRTEKVNDRWWFVDPEGYQFLSVGVDCVYPGGGGNIRDLDKRDGMYKELPPEKLWQSGRRGGSTPSFGLWNLHRRFGDDYQQKSLDLIIKRMDKWGLNTIANWSSSDVYDMNKKAFVLQLRNIGIDGSLMGLADVYAPDFRDKVENSVKSYVEPYKENPWVLGYFLGNEPAWLGQEERLCSMILEGDNRPIKDELAKWLKEGDSPEKRKEFIHNTFNSFLSTVDEAMHKFDPNHLNLGIRFGNVLEIDRNILEICKETFDVLSFNCYDLYPKEEMLNRASEVTGLPMIIGEYHFGTVDRGMAQSLWQVNSQEERGVAYRFYTEKAYSHPGLIGTAYFQWCDQDLTGRFDGENYNCGLVDVTDRPYKYQVEAMMETAKRLYSIHSGELEPVTQEPEKARGHGGIPNLWNE